MYFPTIYPLRYSKRVVGNRLMRPFPSEKGRMLNLQILRNIRKECRALAFYKL